MAHLILPSRRIVQPPGAVEVDWTNPLTRGLVSACKTTSKLTTSNQLLSGGATVSATDNGLGFRFNGSNYLDYPSRQFQGLVNGTFSLWFRVDSFSSTYCIVYEAGDGLNNFSINTPATASSPLLVNVGSNTARYTSKTSWIAGRWYNVIASWGDAIRIYIDGNSEHETITSAYPSGLSSHVTTLGSYNIGSRGQYLVGDLQLPVLFNRALSTAEVKSLSTNPWQIFRPRDNRIYFDVGAASGGGTTYTDSFTESLTASDTHSQSAIFANAISEGLTAADSYLHNAVFADTLSYGITADDALGHIQSILETLTESVTAGFTQSDSLTSGSGTTYNENITESLTAAYSVVDSATFVNALNEALTVSESLADNAVYSVLINEALTAVSTFADSTPGETTLTAADLAAIDALIVARIADIAAATLAAATAAGGIDANMKKTNGYTIIGSGIPPTYANQPTPIDPGDPFRVEGT